MNIKLVSLILIAVVALGSIAARGYFENSGSQDASPVTGIDSATGGGEASSLFPELPSTPDTGSLTSLDDSESGSPVADAMPYVTEGSFFALIGFALGYLSRKVVKIGLIILALFFVGIQTMSYLDVVSVDWDRAVQLVNDLVLNVKENQTVGEILKDRLPTAGGLMAGYLVGFRKG